MAIIIFSYWWWQEIFLLTWIIFFGGDKMLLMMVNVLHNYFFHCNSHDSKPPTSRRHSNYRFLFLLLWKLFIPLWGKFNKLHVMIDFGRIRQVLNQLKHVYYIPTSMETLSLEFNCYMFKLVKGPSNMNMHIYVLIIKFTTISVHAWTHGWK